VESGGEVKAGVGVDDGMEDEIGVNVGDSDGIGIPQSRLEDHARLYNSSRLSQAWIAEAWIL
jgi:hypothetical protein